MISYYRRLNNELLGIFAINRQNTEKMKEMLNSDNMGEYGNFLINLEMLMNDVIKRVSRLLSDEIINEINITDSTNTNSRIAFFAATMGILGIITIFIMIPYLNSLKNQVIYLIM